MAQFNPGVDQVVASEEPRLDVAVSAAAPLKVGKNVFQLQVQDDAGNDSTPATVTIIITDTQRPTAVIDVLDASGARSPAPHRARRAQGSAVWFRAVVIGQEDRTLGAA